MSLAASVASGNAAVTAALNSGRSAAASSRGPPPSMIDPPGIGTAHLGQIIEPTRAFGIGAREDPADLLWIVLVLVIAHIDALVGAQIENFNFAGDVGHDVLERLLNSAQPLIDPPDNFDPATQRHLEVRCGLDGPPLKYIVRADANLVTFRERRRQDVGVVVDVVERRRLVEKLNFGGAHKANALAGCA